MTDCGDNTCDIPLLCLKTVAGPRVWWLCMVRGAVCHFSTDWASFSFPFGMTMDTEAGMIAQSQHWGPATKARLMAQPWMYVLIVCVLTVHYAAMDRAGMWCVSVEDFALFIYSVQCRHKFHWLLGLYAQHPTGTACGLSFACLPSQVLV